MLQRYHLPALLLIIFLILPPHLGYGQSTGDYRGYFTAASEAYKQGNLTEAIAQMQAAYQIAPHEPAVINNLAACYITRGNQRGQKRDLQGLLSDNRIAYTTLKLLWPEGVPQTDAQKSNITIASQNMDVALKGLKQPLTDAAWFAKAAQTLRQSGNLVEAMAMADRSLALNANQPSVLLALGDMLTVKQQYNRALATYEQGREVSKSSVSDALLTRLGMAYGRAKQPQKAVEAFNQALNLNPNNVDPLYGLAHIWQDQIRLNPNNVSAHVNLGAVYQQLGQLDDAQAQYQIADKLSPNNPVIQSNIAKLALSQGNSQGAVQYYQGLLKQNPNHPQALLFLANQAITDNQLAQAIQYLDRGRQTAQDKKPFYDRLITIYSQQKQPEKLTALFKEAIAAFPNDADLLYRAGLFAHEQNRLEEAATFYQNALKLNPILADAWANLGTIYLSQKQPIRLAKPLKPQKNWIEINQRGSSFWQD